MRAVAAALVGVLSFAIAPVDARAEATARAAVEQTVNDVLAVLKMSDLGVAERRTRIEGIAYARFDFETMGKLVLARNWKKFDRAQQAEFIEEFKRHLSRSYGTRIERYEQEEVAIGDERTEQRGDVTVLTTIRGGQFDGIAIDYRLRKRGEDWRVIDVVIEGVSLVSNFRSQFKDIISKEGPAVLIAKLREKNADPETSTE